MHNCSFRSSTSEACIDFDIDPKIAKLVLETMGISLAIHRKKNRYKQSYEEEFLTI
jgi:hypothetical protein